MKALVYQGPGKKALEDRPVPTIKNPTDAIIKVTKTTICGTDLHILKGDVATCAPGRILSHEGIGGVDKIGSGVTELIEKKKKDHASFLSYQEETEAEYRNSFSTFLIKLTAGFRKVDTKHEQTLETLKKRIKELILLGEEISAASDQAILEGEFQWVKMLCSHLREAYTHLN